MGLLRDYKTFLVAFFAKIKELAIDISEMKLDHIAYQASSDEDYDMLKLDVLKTAELIKEDLVEGRRVGVFNLHEPLAYQNYKISILELIAPVEGKETKSGLEHIEFVLDESFDSFMKKYPDLDWNTTAVNRDKYPMLKLKLADGMSVKFPEKSVLDE